jgi:site-specific DNA recombinase
MMYLVGNYVTILPPLWYLINCLVQKAYGENKMRVVIYIRVSTTEQAEEGYSIRAQRSLLIEYAKANGYEVTEIYIDEGLSAKDMNRPQLKRLLADAKSGMFDAVLVYKLDRFTRSARDLYDMLDMLAQYKVGFISKQERFDTTSAMGRLMIGVIAVIAQFERELISERVRMGQEQRTKEGKKHGRFPFGYDKDGNLIPEEFEQLRLIRQLYMVEQLGFKSIAMRMGQLGLTRRGTEWRTASVALALENPFYAGIIEYGGKRPDGKYPQRMRELLVDVIRVDSPHPVIWSKEEYKEHIRMMRKRTNGSYSRKFEYWFTGLLRCSRCGGRMNGSLVLGRQRADGVTPRKPYYKCNNRVDSGKCDMPMFRQEHIEHLLMNYIQALRVNKDITKEEQKRMKDAEKNRDQMIAKIKRDLSAVKERIKKWQYMFVEELISAADLRHELDEENKKEVELNNKLEELQMMDKETNEMKELLFQMHDIWADIEDAEKKELLNSLFDEIKIFTDVTSPKGKKNEFFDARIEVIYR